MNTKIQITLIAILMVVICGLGYGLYDQLQQYKNKQSVEGSLGNIEVPTYEELENTTNESESETKISSQIEDEVTPIENYDETISTLDSTNDISFELVNIYEELYREVENNYYYSYVHNIDFELPLPLEEIHVVERENIITFENETDDLGCIAIYSDQMMPSIKGYWEYLGDGNGKSFYFQASSEATEKFKPELKKELVAWIYNTFTIHITNEPNSFTDETLNPYLISGKIADNEQINGLKDKNSIQKALLGKWNIKADSTYIYEVTFNLDYTANIRSKHGENYNITYNLSTFDGYPTISFKGEAPGDIESYTLSHLTQNKIIADSTGTKASLLLYRNGYTTSPETMMQTELVTYFMDYIMRGLYEAAVIQYGTDEFINREKSHIISDQQLDNMGAYVTKYNIMSIQNDEDSGYYIIRPTYAKYGMAITRSSIELYLEKIDGVWKISDYR